MDSLAGLLREHLELTKELRRKKRLVTKIQKLFQNKPRKKYARKTKKSARKAK